MAKTQKLYALRTVTNLLFIIWLSNVMYVDRIVWKLWFAEVPLGAPYEGLNSNAVSFDLNPSYKVQKSYFGRRRVWLFQFYYRVNNSENWTVKSKDKSRLTAAEMRFMWKTAKYTYRDHKANEEISNELKITSILDRITSYKSDWIQHVSRTPRSRLPNLLTKYASRGVKTQGIPLKRLLDEWDLNRPAMAYFPI
jgi:hypothetical protein